MPRKSAGNDMNGRFCSKCVDLPHRRQQPVCPACDEPHEPERITPIEPRGASMMSQWESF